MSGRIVGIFILVCAAIAGAALYYLQVFGFYERLEPAGVADIQLVAQADANPVPLAHSGFQGIDAASSPIRFRACFETELDLDALTETYVQYSDPPDPRNAPFWFRCFDADAIAAALKGGTARAYLGQKNIAYGVDRVVVITSDGSGYAWHELNDCGEKAYDGTVVGEDCPPRPDDG